MIDGQTIIEIGLGMLDSLALIGPAMTVLADVPTTTLVSILAATALYWLDGRPLLAEATGVPAPWDVTSWRQYNSG